MKNIPFYVGSCEVAALGDNLLELPQMFRAGFRVGEPAVLARAGETVVLFPFDEAAPAPPSPIWKCNVLEGFRFRVPEEVDVRFGKGSAVTFVGEVTHIRISTQGILQGTNWISVFRRQVSGP